MFRLGKSYSLAILTLASGVAMGQIGTNEAACRKVWGSPLGGSTLDAEGNGTLRYAQRDTSVSLEFSQGLAWNAIYTKAEFSKKDIDSLLQLNGNGNKWNVWTPPGIPVSKLESAMWACDNEAGMAYLKDGEFSIKGTRGHLLAERQHEPDPVSKVAVEPDKPEEQPAKVVAAKKAVKKAAPKPLAPDVLPVLGDTKDVAIRLLGEPSGVMESGGKEIMVYSWGSVWFSGGKVCEIN